MGSSWMLLILAALAGLASFAWLALAMDIHWHKVHGHGRAHPAAQLKLLGWAGLMFTAVLCFLADRPSMAVLVWIMLLVASAPIIGMILSWRPQLLRIFWPIG